MPSAIEASTFAAVFFTFGIGHGFSDGVDVHGVWITLRLVVLRIIVSLPCKRIRPSSLVLEWRVFFERLALEPVTMLLLRTLNPLREVFRGVLHDAGRGEGSLETLRERSERVGTVLVETGASDEILEGCDVLIESSILHA